MGDTKGLILDLRWNGGGSEPLGREIVARWVGDHEALQETTGIDEARRLKTSHELAGHDLKGPRAICEGTPLTDVDFSEENGDESQRTRD